jgi:hypothetical protein
MGALQQHSPVNTTFGSEIQAQSSRASLTVAGDGSDTKQCLSIRGWSGFVTTKTKAGSTASIWVSFWVASCECHERHTPIVVVGKKARPPRRYSCYATYHVPDEQEWKHQCDRLLILHLTTSTSPPKLKAERRTAYEKVRSALADVFPYIDVLGGNHLAAIAGTLGILPLWVTTEIEIDKTGRSFEWLLTKFFDNERERSSIKPDDVISNLLAALKTRFVGDFSRRSVENIVCKVYRRHTKSKTDRRFFDILYPNQNLYSVHANII